MKQILGAVCALLLIATTVAMLGPNSGSTRAQMVIDGSTKQSYERSLEAMVEDMSEADRDIFSEGLIGLMLEGYPPARGAKGLELFVFLEPAVDAAPVTLDGVTKDEIMARGLELSAKEAVKLVADKSEADEKQVFRSCIQKHVSLNNLRIEADGSWGRRITMDVTNRLPWAIAGIRIAYVARSEGRTVPWHKDDFSVGISGGIEPGETREVATFDTQFPSDAPEEVTLVAEVVDVADAEERQLIRDVIVIGWSEEKSPLMCD